MIIGLLSTALFQYVKCQDQRISKNCRSTFIFCSSWNLWGGCIFYIQLARGGPHPVPPSVTPLYMLPHHQTTLISDMTWIYVLIAKCSVVEFISFLVSQLGCGERTSNAKFHNLVSVSQRLLKQAKNATIIKVQTDILKAKILPRSTIMWTIDTLSYALKFAY